MANLQRNKEGNMATRKAAVKKTTVKKTATKKSAPAKKATVKRTPVKKAPAKKTTAKRTPAKKTVAKKATVKKTTAKKAPAKAPAKKASPKKAEHVDAPMVVGNYLLWVNQWKHNAAQDDLLEMPRGKVRRVYGGREEALNAFRDDYLEEDVPFMTSAVKAIAALSPLIEKAGKVIVGAPECRVVMNHDVAKPYWEFLVGKNGQRHYYDSDEVDKATSSGNIIKKKK
jgi:cell envelope opacity-associated protein A